MNEITSMTPSRSEEFVKLLVSEVFVRVSIPIPVKNMSFLVEEPLNGPPPAKILPI
jgi:hypothetical protein